MTDPDAKSWKIYLSATEGLMGGWYGGVPFSINDCVYMRAQESEAITFRNKRQVIDMVRACRNKGYPCHAVPTINLHEVI